MFHCEPHSVRTHDLLEIDANDLISVRGSAPEWVEEVLRKSPFGVVRRGRVTEQEIPVGIRGLERSQRWATFCHPKVVKSVLTPPQLLGCNVPISRADAVPAFRALNVLKVRWTDVDLPWGPTGSVGFELATGRPVTNQVSDLDIAIRARDRISREQARSLWELVVGLQTKVDVRVETAEYGFSLEEFACTSCPRILLRYPDGLILGDDPWSGCLSTTETAT
jgi:phosphoribosyl-dephospho-CoA transferase